MVGVRLLSAVGVVASLVIGSGGSAARASSLQEAVVLPPAPEEIKQFRAEYLPDGSGIVAMEQGEEDDSAHLIRMNTDGSDIRRLDTGGLFVSSFDISPDSRLVAFTGSGPDGINNVYLFDLATASVTPLTRGRGNGEPAWSPDGRRIVFARDPEGDDDLWVMNADGTNQVRLTSNPVPEYAPEWSPDGSRIVFMSEQDILPSVHVINADGTGEYAVTWGAFYEGYPKWSPDGSRIAYMSTLGGTETWSLLTVNADGSDKRELAMGHDWTWHPAWSPDGSTMLFDSRRDGRWGVWAMNVDGSGQRKLTHRTTSPAVDIARTAGPGAFASALATARTQNETGVFYLAPELRAVAHEWIAEGRYQDAAALLELALADDPASFDLHMVRSVLYRAQGKPTPPQARELVDLFMRRGYHAANEAFADAQRDFPGWVTVRRWRFDVIGRRHIRAGLTGAGLDMLRLNTEFFPDSVSTHRRLGDALRDAGMKAEARAAYQRALRLTPADEQLRSALRALDEE